MKKVLFLLLVFALTIKAQVLVPTNSDLIPNKLKEGDIKKLHLEEMVLSEPWKCLNYDERKKRFVISTLPAGTIILTNVFNDYYKADCGNRLLSLENQEDNPDNPEQADLKKQLAQAKIEQKNLAREKQLAELQARSLQAQYNYGGVVYYPYPYYYGGYYNYPYSGYNRNVWVGSGVRFYADPQYRSYQRLPNPGAYHTGSGYNRGGQGGRTGRR